MIRSLRQFDLQTAMPSRAESRRWFAVQILGRIRDRRATQALITCLEKDPSDSIRVFTPLALERIGDLSTEPSLVSALQNPYPDIQTGAAHALGTFRSVRAIPDLIALLGAPAVDPAYRGGGIEGPDPLSPAPAAAWALGNIGARAVPALRKALSSPVTQVHRYVALGLTCNPSVEVNSDVRALLQDPDPQVRECASRSEANRRDPLALLWLAELLHDPAPEVRQVTAYALSNSRGLSALKVLIAAADGPNRMAALTASEGLRNIWAPDAFDLLLAEVKRGKGLARLGAAESLLHYRDPRVVVPLLALLDEPDPRLHTLGVWVVTGLLDSSTFPAIVSAASDPNEQVRIHATELLGFQKSDRVVAPLLAKLQDPSEPVRLLAIEGLGFRGDQGAVAPLKALVATGSPLVPAAARKALEIIDSKHADR